MNKPEPVLAVNRISKTFPGQRALSEVSLEIVPGEVHALLGQNGSGKSTFIKCLSGYHTPDAGSGDIVVGGVTLPKPHTSQEAHAAGLTFIHQDLGLVPSLSVLENFCLGRDFETGFGYGIRWGNEARRLRQLMHVFGHPISPWTLVRHLPRADWTIVAIIRALAGIKEHGGVLVLDEPTAAFPKSEVDRLFAAIRRVAARGAGVLYVTHRLQEVFELAHRATVLRDGELVGTFDLAELSENELVELIIGRKPETYYPPISADKNTDTLLRTEDLAGDKISNVSFSLRRGEIVGVAGLLGSGCTELGRLLFGAAERRSGKVWYKGKEVEYRAPEEAMADGVAMLTEDRHHDGSFPMLTVGENITISDLRPFWKKGFLRMGDARKEAFELVHKLGVKPPDPDRRFYTLSGGNQQKVILAKWIRLKPDLLICDEPVVGVDVGAKADVYALLEKTATKGTSILLISSEFKDLPNLCHRVVVLGHGRIVAELVGEDLTENAIADAVYLGEAGNA
jgi:ribose transport system ATP-binding protein